MTVSLFSVVVGDPNEDRLEAYLYDHTKLVASVTVGRRAAYLLCTTVDSYNDDEGHTPEVDRCEYLARYQVGRLQSGLYGERACGVTQTAATNVLRYWLAREVDPTTLATP